MTDRPHFEELMENAEPITKQPIIKQPPIVLERLKVGKTRFIPQETYVQIVEGWDPMRQEVRGMILEVEAYVLADKCVEDQQVYRPLFWFPSSPWQHFKHKHRESWWLGWLVRRRPVRQTAWGKSMEVDFTRYATYPKATYPVPPEFGKPVWYETERMVEGDQYPVDEKVGGYHSTGQPTPEDQSRTGYVKEQP